MAHNLKRTNPSRPLRQWAAAVLLLICMLSCQSAKAFLFESPQYMLIIDAGSTGSRVHVYRFLFGMISKLPDVTDDFFKEVKPGLSSYKDDVSLAGESLRPLLEFAETFVPENQMASTQVHVMATAGLRLLSDDVQRGILSSVRRVISASPFQSDDEWVNIMSGEDEAIGGWVTTNYLLGTLSDARPKTVGMLDLGGASTQVACETHRQAATDIVTVGGRQFPLFVHSHLRFGLMQARNAIDEAIVKESKQHEPPVGHPCMARGYTTKVQFKSTQVDVVGTGDGVKCHQHISAYMKRLQRGPAQCASKNRWLAMSYYRDVLEPLGLKPTASVLDIRRRASVACSAPWAEQQHLDSAMTEGFAGRACGDLHYIASLLVHAVGVPDRDLDRMMRHSTPIQRDSSLPPVYDGKITIAKKLQGKELSWSLGALIARVDMPDTPLREALISIAMRFQSMPPEGVRAALLSGAAAISIVVLVSLSLLCSRPSRHSKQD